MAKDLIKNGKAGKSSTSFSLIVIRDLSIRRQKVFRLAPGEQTPKQDDGAVTVKLERDRHRMNNGTKYGIRLQLRTISNGMVIANLENRDGITRAV